MKYQTGQHFNPSLWLSIYYRSSLWHNKNCFEKQNKTKQNKNKNKTKKKTQQQQSFPNTPMHYIAPDDYTFQGHCKGD